MMKRIKQSKMALACMLLIVFISGCEQLNREDNREPEAPTNFDVTSENYGEVSFTWKPVNDATEYEIFHSTQPEPSTAASLISTNLSDPKFDESLTPGEKYHFWVRSKNGTRASSYSSMKSVIVENKLLAPINLVVTSENYEEVSLTWDVVVGATEYEVFHSENNDSSKAALSDTTEQTHFTTTLTPNEEYYFWVKAKDSTIKSGFSEMKSVTVLNTLSAPQGFSATSNAYGKIFLEWYAVSGATEYEVFHSESEADTSSRTSLGTTEKTNFTKDLTPTKRYYFWVMAKNATIKSEYSSSAYDKIETLSAPADFLATSSTYGKVSLTWSAIRDATEYDVFYSEKLDSTTAYPLDTTPLTNFTASLTPGKTYHFWVMAKNATEKSPFSSVASVTVESTPPAIFAPKNLVVTSDKYGEAFLTWATADSALKYEIFYSQKPDYNTATSLSTTITLNNFTATRLTPDEKYYFWVKAKNDTATSDFSDMANVTVKTLSAPANFLVTSENYGEVSLTWDAAGGATEYEAFYSENEDSDVATELTTTTNTSFTTTELILGTTYYFWVRAKSTAETSDFSDMKSVTVKTLSAPANFNVTSENYGEVSLSWNKVAHATGYDVFYSKTEDFSNLFSTTTMQTTTNIDKNLTIDETYYFKVQAKNDTVTSDFSVTKDILVNKVLIKTVLVDKGSFEVKGGAEITVDSFYMGIYEVTQGQWREVMKNNPSTNKPELVWSEHPVTNISWYNAVEFCNKLSKKEGRELYYKIDKDTKDENNTNTDAADKLRWTVTIKDTTGIVDNSGVGPGLGYRLPTEAEWEYAARGGNKTNDSLTYSGSNTIGDVAWYKLDDGTSTTTQTVGGKNYNDLKLYDMSGNVAEWCWDWTTAYYPPADDVSNPLGAEKSTARVMRGGSVNTNAENCRVIARSHGTPSGTNSYYGFRVVRSATATQ